MNPYLKYLLAGTYLWTLGEGLLGPLYTVFAQQIGGSVLQLSGAYATYLIVTGSLTIWVGSLSDRLSKEKLMIAGYALNALATFGFLLVDTPWKLFVVQAVLGVAAALSYPTWDSLFAEHIDVAEDGLEYGLSTGGMSIIMGVALILGGVLVTYTSFTTLFLLMGSIQVVATVVQSFVLRDLKASA